MANASVYAAFERMWQHVIARLNDRASLEHTHEIAHVNGLETTITNKQDKEDNSLRTTDKTITGAINQLYDNSIVNVTQSSYTSADGTPMTDIKIKMNNGYQHAFSIKEGGAQPDWNQNDENAPDYIKNRTHWFDEEEVDILSESTLNVDPETGSVIFEINTIPIIGQTYAVTYNSEEYNCVAGEYTDGKSTGVALGNIGAITGENMTDEPFIVVCVSDQIAVAMSLNGDESFTLKITGNGRVYHKVPDEYLPEFSRNIVDGIMPGSIRSITSCEEDGVNYVLGENASSFGENTKASGYGSHAEGGETIASGDFSHAEGNNTEASKGNSHAEGSNSKAYGYGSHAEGGETTASGDFSHTEGSQTIASGLYSHAEGRETTASGQSSHTEGHQTTASGDSSHAEGSNTTASGSYSHAEGNFTEASGLDSHAEGYGATASGDYSHAEGYGTTASGNYSHAEGYRAIASGSHSHAEGSASNIAPDTITNESTNEDIINIWNSTSFLLAKGENSHAEGLNTLALGKNSHAEGENTIASDSRSHAEGWNTTASDIGSHAEGWNTTASDIGSHAEGYQTTASGLDSHAEGSNTTASGDNSHAEGSNTTAFGDNSHAEGGAFDIAPDTITNESTNEDIINIWNSTSFLLAKGMYSHAEGMNTLALGDYSHAEGKHTIASGEDSHAEGYYTTASGEDSHAEGSSTTASGLYAHAEGRNTTASGQYSHTEGYQTTASGGGAHTEGWQTTASGSYSHAEGENTIASGNNSHAEGEQTIASGECQHVQGIYNIEDTNNKYAHIVGNGSTQHYRSNAYTLDWDGLGWFAGGLKVGGTGQDDANAKLIATEEYVDRETAGVQNHLVNNDLHVILGERAKWNTAYDHSQDTSMHNAYSSFSFTNAVSTYATTGPEDPTDPTPTEFNVSAQTSNHPLKFIATNNLIEFNASDMRDSDEVEITIHADPEGAADEAEANAKAYADSIKNDLLNGAGAAYDTLKELGELIDENHDAITVLEQVATNKADKAEVEALKTQVTATSLILADAITGQKYEIQIQNGQLVSFPVEE